MEHPIGNLMETTMQKIREMVDANTIIGKPIETGEGVTLIPISKVSFGFASGGADMQTKVENKDNGVLLVTFTVPAGYTSFAVTDIR